VSSHDIAVILAVAGDTVVACGVMLLLASKLWQVFLLLLAVLLLLAFLLLKAFLLLLASLMHPAVPIFTSRLTYWTVQCDILQDYRTIGLLLSDCNFFLLSDIGSRPQSIGLSDIGLRKNQRLHTSA
jgi:hypothetical protein